MTRSTQPIEDLPGIPRDADGPVFRAPWEAQAFGMTLALHERGLFTWREWADALGVEIKAAAASDDGSHYYEYWLAALEKLVAAKGLVTVTELLQRKNDWDAAARATPHGKPIELKNRP
ncbi:MAG: nitrile hydratase accessory protein [Gammaproteobacteria bacterium]|nr:nitrile hydratase accessory protein [Gammaproteobacteria bacterium]